ncbi:MAG: hypothetical protein AAF458_06870 [Pseudomonadota bacterium]
MRRATLRDSNNDGYVVLFETLRSEKRSALHVDVRMLRNNDALIVDDRVGDNRGLVGFLGPHVRFGAAHSSQVGGANYAAVSFSSLPAPVSEPHTALLLVGLPLLVAMRARRRRTS